MTETKLKTSLVLLNTKIQKHFESYFLTACQCSMDCR